MGKDPPVPSPEFVPEARLLAAIIESSDDAIITKDLQSVVRSWNRAATEMFGYAAQEMIGQPITAIFPPDRLAEEQAILSRIREGERVEHYETVRLHKDGRKIDVSITVSPIHDEHGRIVGASKIARDISERIRVHQRDFLLSAIVSSSDDAIVSKNLEGTITSWNAAAERIFGYTANEMIGQPVLKIIPPERWSEEPNILARIGRGERIEHFQTERVRKDGKLVPVSLTISPVRDADGKVIGASKIARDITELKRISAEREALLESERTARMQAEHASRMKDEFLSTISHELRTPLNAILGWAEVLKLNPGADDLRTGVGVIERNARVQAQLIDDMLDLGRIAAGKMTLSVEPLDLHAIIRDAIASVQHAADVKGIRIKTILDDIRGGMVGDTKRLQQVVWNLLNNAIKFTPKGGRVIVGVVRTNSHVDLSVEDNGEGIDPKFMPYIFDRFRQADATTTRRHGGLGIGLSLVKQLVELHAGSVRAESPGVGHGAKFTVTLPVIATQPHAAGSPQARTSAAPLADLGNVRVLVVDDDVDSLHVIARVLRAQNAQVEIAASVDEALNRLKSFSPDVLLSDIGMPEKDGFDLIARVRSLPNGSVPAAALTALARAEDRMRVLQAGFQAHIGKPVTAAELVAVVRSLAGFNRPRSTL